MAHISKSGASTSVTVLPLSLSVEENEVANKQNHVMRMCELVEGAKFLLCKLTYVTDCLCRQLQLP